MNHFFSLLPKYFFQYISDKSPNIPFPQNDGNSQFATSNDNNLTTGIQPTDNDGMSEVVCGDSKQPGKAKMRSTSVMTGVLFTFISLRNVLHILHYYSFLTYSYSN